MKLIQKGKRHPNMVYKGICQSCDSIFESTKGELMSLYLVNGIGDYTNFVLCPECGGGSDGKYWKGILFQGVAV